MRYHLNRYPVGEPRREDRIAGAEAWVGYRFGRFTECRIYGRADDRRSSEDALGYRAMRVGTELRFGAR